MLIKTIEKMPDYGKLEFEEQEAKDFTKSFPNALKNEISLLKELIKYDSRISAKEVKNY